MTLAALLVANGLVLLAPFLYAAGRLRLLLLAVPLYLAANGTLLAGAFPHHPLLTCAVASLLGILPVLVLILCLLDFRFGLFATDLFWGLAFVIFGLLPLAVVSSVLHVLSPGGLLPGGW